MNDHQHVLDPNLTPEDLIMASAAIIDHLYPPPGVGIAQLEAEHMIGLRALENQFNVVLGVLESRGCFNNATNAIRGLLAFTANIATNAHSPFRVTEVEYNLICDIHPP